MELGDSKLRAVRVLGQGTFGRVFLCHQIEVRGQPERKVCVKRIIVRNPKTELGLIKEEVYIISQLRHPHIVEFLRSFSHAGTVNIVMEYVPNGTLRDVIQQLPSGTGGVNQDRLMRYFRDMVVGLEYLHIRCVIHRDIKPENMLLDANDRVKIADFGIANVHAPSTQLQAGMGTPMYMAPEAMSSQGRVDFKSDVWSLGLVLYELCLGRSPFAAFLDKNATPALLHTVVQTLVRPRLDCQLIRRLYDPVWAQVCELMVVYEQERRICLPDIFHLDAGMTVTLYKQYFGYTY
ncbi:CBL-interacting protein kinase 25 [Drosophila mauritiana]|uniref:CBL-interacting protein kinase 25 n=1 Tax=Drosophila mauritiana TaxID=7226 RepID=A0A6P8L022_DROMA|nr:CBL-interacting protein kinase 25 [Drosophila mauritiana]